MKLFKRLLSCIFTIALIIICFVTSVEFVLIHTDAVNKEYKKYNVYSAVNVTEEDLRKVNEEMYDYLRGKRENLYDIKTTVDGEPEVAFFNERECSHMADCRTLFIAGLEARKVAAIICVCILIVFILLKDVPSVFSATPGTAIGFIAAVGVMAYIVSMDFDAWFVKFHLTFFDNDLWLLDPATDRLINIMPEGYFMDLALYCLIVFLLMMAALLIVSVIINSRRRKKVN